MHCKPAAQCLFVRLWKINKTDSSNINQLTRFSIGDNMHNFNETTTISTARNQLTNNDGESTAINKNVEVIFAGSSSKNDNNQFAQHQYSNQFNSCRTLQRKLELKVERAKKNFSQSSENEAFNVVSRPNNR